MTKDYAAEHKLLFKVFTACYQAYGKEEARALLCWLLNQFKPEGMRAVDNWIKAAEGV